MKIVLPTYPVNPFILQIPVQTYFCPMLKVGILGGGQLGRMLLQAAANYQVETHVMENDDECPAAHLCRYFIKGNIRDFDDVYNFGKSLDALTIEIENVNIDALEKLESEGVKIYPKPSVLRIIKNKVYQKQYYLENGIPTSEFAVLQSLKEIDQWEQLLPAVQKLAEGGYDGRGVQIIDDLSSSHLGFDAHSVLEKKIKIKKEVAAIIAVDQDGKTALYPPVEMVFNKDLNLLDYQLCPADIPQNVLWKVEAVSLAVVRNFKSPGLFAVELFVDQNDDVFVNETAPRVHNSGHHTIEAHYSSQFDMLW
ncbi:MAG TPA: ATP-grasp domain-containing protein, partial [Flavisolibacter sp.]|nr:ATP-grasp domain-containing protein [Flavisolibacter sp.]